jgi:hypothetical protein
MNLIYCVGTRDGNSYRGTLLGGAFEVAGHQFQAASCECIELDWNPAEHVKTWSGRVTLTDGTYLKLPMHAIGRRVEGRPRQLEATFSGEIILNVGGLDSTLTIPAHNIQYLFRSGKYS